MRTLLVLLCLLSLLIGCSPSPTPASFATTSPTATPWPATNTPTPTLVALPTVPAAKTSVAGSRHPTATPSITPSQTLTPTFTPSPSPTFTPSATATWTFTPRPSGPTITPTETITPTPTPTLTPTPIFSPTPLPTVTVSKDVMHVLLIGLDSTHNLRAQNTDVIIVAALNKATKQVSLLSIPRDLWVYIPTQGWSRINTAHRRGYAIQYPGGGPALLMRTIEVNFGIPIDHWARVDFQGFIRVVDELGGVDMVVPCRVNLRYTPPTSETEEEMILEPGVYHMDGSTALHYVRTRRGGTDFDRARRQHQFLKAMWHQLKNTNIILRIPGLWSALKDSFETDLNLGDVLSLAPLALDIKPQRIRSRYIGPAQVTNWTTAEGWSVLLPDYEKIQQVVAGLYAPPSASEEQVANEAARIGVRNGTFRPQLALIAADQLRWHGLTVTETGPADQPGYKQTRIIVYHQKPKALELLMQLLKVKPENVIQQPDPGQSVDVQVILGEDYDPCQ